MASWILKWNGRGLTVLSPNRVCYYHFHKCLILFNSLTWWTCCMFSRFGLSFNVYWNFLILFSLDVAHLANFQVSTQRASIVLLFNRTMISSLSSMLIEVQRHGPALTVTPVLMPVTYFCSSILWVFSHLYDFLFWFVFLLLSTW